jgi:hypothetical protein
MTGVVRDRSGFVVSATLLAGAFKMTEEAIRQAMRDGTLTSVCEVGVDADHGRWRLTFRLDGRACRFTVDDAGTVLSQAAFPVRTTARPAP